MNITAVSVFVAFVILTLYITVRASRRSRTTRGFYAADSQFGGFVNGVAITGDFLSAATFLGITGLLFSAGLDTAFYLMAPLVGLSIMLFAFAGPFRRLGRFTLGDVVAFRLKEAPVRTFAAITSLVIVLLYLIVQFVGAGKLMQGLFGIDFRAAVLVAGGLTMIYVSLGGMIATTWVQVIKATLIVATFIVITLMILYRFGFSLPQLYATVAEKAPHGADLFNHGNLYTDNFSLLSFCIAIPLGMAGMPHLLMRLFTVPSARQARLSIFWAIFFIGVCMILLLLVIGFGAAAILPDFPQFYADGKIIGGSNMVALHLSKAIGGSAFFGFVSTVIFATILAVVSGLILAGASAFSHDLYTHALRRGNTSQKAELQVTRIAIFVLGGIGILLAFAFEKQNIAYMATLAFAVSASTNFPVLILSLYWRGLTTRGMVIGGSVGLISTVALLLLGPTVWVDVLGHAAPVFPYKYPALITCPLAFVTIYLVSRYDGSARGILDRDGFDAQCKVAFKNRST
jgi:cation/acetate symporter